MLIGHAAEGPGNLADRLNLMEIYLNKLLGRRLNALAEVIRCTFRCTFGTSQVISL